MKPGICTLAAAVLLSGSAASAQPSELTNLQMDGISAGHFELDLSNTSLTMVSIFDRAYLTDPTANTISCSNCYLLIVTPTISVGSQIGP